MAKALELNGDALAAAPPVPRAAQVASLPVPTPEAKARSKPVKAKADAQVPLQVRWPRSAVKAAKLATVQGDYQSVSEFMLACFHAYMKTRKAE